MAPCVSVSTTRPWTLPQWKTNSQFPQWRSCSPVPKSFRSWIWGQGTTKFGVTQTTSTKLHYRHMTGTLKFWRCRLDSQTPHRCPSHWWIPLSGKYCVNSYSYFFYDILIYSLDCDSHLHLRKVFTQLQAHCLLAKLSKWEFRWQTIVYLGLIISGAGIAIDPDKIQVITNWPILDFVKALRGFMGLCDYYRWFATNYSQLVAPLTELLRKDAFVWKPSTTHIFQQLW